MSTKQTMSVVNEAGNTFNVKLVRAGERYGRGGTLVAERAMVEFYDAEYAGRKGFDAEGQFVQRYDVHSLVSNNPAQLRRLGLALNCGVAKWQVSGANMTAVLDWLLSVLA